MSVFPILAGVSAIQTIPSVTNPMTAGQQQAATPPSPTPGTGSPVVNQGWQVVVTCTGGACSGTIQPIASNDGVNWSTLGSTIAASSAGSPVNAIGVTSGVYAYYSAYVTAIAGTGAKVSASMSA